MAEIYRNTTQYITLDIYGGNADGTPSAVIVGDSPYPLAVTGPDPNFVDFERWTATLPLSQTQDVRNFEVLWEFSVINEDFVSQEASKLDRFNIVVPLVDLDDLRRELELGTDVTDAQLILLERRVRQIVESHTQQEFAPRAGVELITANGGPVLSLQRRLITINSLTNMHSMLPWSWHTIVNDGWGIRRNWGYQDVVDSNAPIHAPSLHGRYAEWHQGIPWKIDGVWGYNAVPSRVQEAALALCEQRICAQSSYRDNYLSSMKASDWRFDYFQESIIGTGNVVADQLLEEYVNHGAAVV